MQGADIDPLDSHGHTPMLLAATKQAWGAVDVLLQAGAKCCIRDQQQRNLLHLIIINGGRLETVVVENCKKVSSQNFFKNVLNGHFCSLSLTFHNTENICVYTMKMVVFFSSKSL